MTPSQIYVAAAIIFLAVVAFWVFRRNINPKTKRLSRMAAIAFGFVLAGIVFGENRSIGYSLMIIGLILSVVDIYLKSKK